jgi:hypothetical protein
LSFHPDRRRINAIPTAQTCPHDDPSVLYGALPYSDDFIIALAKGK